MEEFIHSERTNQILNELSNKSQSYKDSENLDINSVGYKLKAIYGLIAQKKAQQCGSIIKDFQDCAIVETNSDGSYNIKPITGKEEEVVTAFSRLSECEENYNNYISSLVNTCQHLAYIEERQFDYCVTDCEKSNSDEGDSLRTCIQNCYNFSNDYSVKTNEYLVSEQIKLIEEKLNKL